MFLFNTTFTVDVQLQQGWLTWVTTVYAPAIRAVAPAARHELYSIDGSIRDGAISFSSQWRCDSIGDLGAIRSASGQLCADMMETHGEKCLAFSTMMKGIVTE